MAGSRKTEYEIAMLVGGQVQASFGNSINSVNSGFDAMVNMAETAARMAESAFDAAAQTVGQFAVDALETYSGFEQSMANTAATANATQLQYAQLESAAREMGKATTKTAAEASDALGYMMLAGWDVDEAITGLEPVLRLSEATQMDLAVCSDLVTDSMSALGLSVDDLGGYLDVCTMANNSANTSAQALMEAFIGCGGAAKTIGKSLGDSRMVLNETATALGILANNGVKGAEAGTAMNAMLIRMTSKDTAKKAMEELGVSAFDASGKFIGLRETLIELQGALSNIEDDEIRAAYMSDIAGTQYYTKMSYLLDAVAESADGAQSAWDDLSGKLGQSDGALLRMADRVTDTMEGAKARLESAVDDAKISFADVFADDLKDAINGMAEFIPTLTQKFVDFSAKAGPKVSKAFRDITKGAGKAWDVVSEMGGWVIDNFDTVETVIAGVGGAIITYKVISGLAGVAGAIKDVGGALKTMTISNPWLLGITLAATAIAGVVSAVKTAEKQAAQSNLAEHFGSIALSMDEVAQAAEHIVMSDNLGRIQESLAAFEELDGIQRSMQDSIKAIDKMNWKVSIGMELSADEIDSYQYEIENYVAQVQDFILQKDYAVNLSLTGFTDGKSVDLVAKMNSFFMDTYDEAERVGKELGAAMMDAFADGILTQDEAEAIANLQAQLAKIQAAVAESDFDAQLKIMEMEQSGGELDADSFKALQEEVGEQTAAASAQYKESLSNNLSAAQQTYNAGYYTDNEYNEMVDRLWQEYLSQVTETEAKGVNFQLNTILQQYGSELEPAIRDYQQKIQDIMEEYGGEENTADWLDRGGMMWDSIARQLDENTLDKTTIKAIEPLVEALGPYMERMEDLQAQFAERGMDAPLELREFISDMQTLNAMVGKDEDSIYYVFGQAAADNPYYQELTSVMDENGRYVPESFTKGVDSNMDAAIVPAVDRLYTNADGHLREVFSKEIRVPVNVTLDLEASYNREEAIAQLPVLHSTGSTGNLSKGRGSLAKIDGHADGGIFHVPHIAWFAEDGPEAVIPIDGSSSAVSIWEQAGQLLGVFDGGVEKSCGEKLYNGITGSQISNYSSTENTDAVQITYAPQITAEKGADLSGIEEVLRRDKEQFREMFSELFEEYLKERGRRAFGR